MKMGTLQSMTQPSTRLTSIHRPSYRRTVMHHSPSRGQIRPKFSSMPRQQSEAAAFLDSYKLTVEKKRLQQELSSINQRRDQILQRLAAIDRTVDQLDDHAKKCRTHYAQGDRPISSPTAHSGHSANTPTNGQPSEIKTLFVDY